MLCIYRSWHESHGCELYKDIVTEGCTDGSNDGWFSGDFGFQRLKPVTVQKQKTCACANDQCHFCTSDGTISVTLAGHMLNGRDSEIGPALATGDRSRLKIIKDGEDCRLASQAEGVSGLKCTSSGVCGPKPSINAAGDLTWSNIKIDPSIQDETYLFCYNAGHTFENTAWFQVPGSYVVEADNLKFNIQFNNGGWESQSSAEVVRTTTDPFRIVVESVNAFSGPANSGWTVKLVAAHLACTVQEWEMYSTCVNDFSFADKPKRKKISNRIRVDSTMAH